MTFKDAERYMRAGHKMRPPKFTNCWFEMRGETLTQVFESGSIYNVNSQDHIRNMDTWDFVNKEEGEKIMSDKNKVTFSWGHVENYNTCTAHHSAVWAGGKNTAILPSFAGIKGLCERIRQRTGQENKIECIATLRSFTNLGLREAKDIIEEIGLKKPEPKEFVFVRDTIDPMPYTAAAEIKIMALDVAAAEAQLKHYGIVPIYWKQK